MCESRDIAPVTPAGGSQCDLAFRSDTISNDNRISSDKVKQFGTKESPYSHAIIGMLPRGSRALSVDPILGPINDADYGFSMAAVGRCALVTTSHIDHHASPTIHPSLRVPMLFILLSSRTSEYSSQI